MGKISLPISKSNSFFASPVCHEAGIWNNDTSVSRYVKEDLSEVELQNIKLTKVTIFISNSSQIQGLQNVCSVHP